MSIAAMLCLCALLPGARSSDAPRARVEVLEGRALLAAAGALESLEERTPGRWIAGPAHLELPAGSRARVSWSGRGSLLLEGRTVLEWTPSEERGGALDWNFAVVSRAHLELRRGPADLHLAGGWSALFHGGTCFLRGLSGGNVELVHSAGLPIDLWPPALDGRARVPFTIVVGAQVRLIDGTARPLALAGSGARLGEAHQRLRVERLDGAPRLPAWQGFAWPWGTSLERVALAWPAGAAGGGSPGEEARPAIDLPELPVRLPGEGAVISANAREVSRVQPVGAAPQAAAPGEPPAPAQPAAGPAPAGAAPGPGGPPAPAGAPDGAGGTPDARLPREQGLMVLSPYGPRWIELSRPVDPAWRASLKPDTRP